MNNLNDIFFTPAANQDLTYDQDRKSTRLNSSHGGWDGLLPYGKEIDRCATEGGMFQAIKYCNPKYTASLNKVLDALEQMELAEQAAEDADDEDEFEEDDADE